MDGVSGADASPARVVRSDDGNDTPPCPPMLLVRCPRCMTCSPLAEGVRATDVACPSCGTRVMLVGENTLDYVAGQHDEAAPGQKLRPLRVPAEVGGGRIRRRLEGPRPPTRSPRRPEDSASRPGWAEGAGIPPPGPRPATPPSEYRQRRKKWDWRKIAFISLPTSSKDCR